MNQLITYSIAIIILALGIPIGDILARYTKEELKAGKKWFKLIIILSLLFALASAILGQDALLFALLFIAVVTSRSLKK